jgi:hypothetical protein
MEKSEWSLRRPRNSPGFMYLKESPFSQGGAAYVIMNLLDVFPNLAFYVPVFAATESNFDTKCTEII